MNEREEIPPWLIVLGLGAVGFIIYQAMKIPKAIANNPITQGVSSAIADTYAALTFGPPVQASGMLDDETGNVLGPISSFPAAHDSQGNTYLNVYGKTYQLGPRDAQGNFTAIAPGNTGPMGSTSPTGSTGSTGSTNLSQVLLMRGMHRGSFGFLGDTGLTGAGNGATGSTVNFGLTNPNSWGNTASAASASKALAPVGSTSNPIQLPTTTITAKAGLSTTQLVVIGIALALAALVILSPATSEKHAGKIF